MVDKVPGQITNINNIDQADVDRHSLNDEDIVD